MRMGTKIGFYVDGLDEGGCLCMGRREALFFCFLWEGEGAAIFRALVI